MISSSRHTKLGYIRVIS